MNENNLRELRTELIRLGIGDNMEPILRENLGKGEKTFNISVVKPSGEGTLEAQLHFRQNASNDYEISRFKATLSLPDQEKRTHNFFLGNGNARTDLEQAFNLLSGRAVLQIPTNKSGEKYETWNKFDLQQKDDYGNYKVQQFHQNYGFDLPAALGKIPLVPMDTFPVRDMIENLYRGNLHPVELTGTREGLTTYIGANPQYKAIDIYDENKRLLSKSHRDLAINGNQNIVKEPAAPSITAQKSQSSLLHKTQGEAIKPTPALVEAKKTTHNKTPGPESLLPKRSRENKKGKSI